MKQFPIFRAGRLVRLAGTVLTVSLLVTLRIDTSCEMSSGAAPRHQLHEVGLRQP